jgi:hypothetical protein
MQVYPLILFVDRLGFVTKDQHILCT